MKLAASNLKIEYYSNYCCLCAPTSAHPTPDSALTSPHAPALLPPRRTVKAIESMLSFQAKTIVGVRNVLRGSGVLRHRELPNRGPVLREGVAAVAERAMRRWRCTR